MVTSHCQFELLTWEVCAALPRIGVSLTLKWADTPITFSQDDHPKSIKGIGQLPLVVSLMIYNIKVTRMLVDGGAGLNLLSPEIFQKMQVPPGHVTPTKPFYGVTPELNILLGQVPLMVTFGTRDNYRMERVVFDVVEFDLPYNGILGRPALAHFMAVTHYAYLVVKIPGPRGPIAIPANEPDAVLSAEQLFLPMATFGYDDDCSGSEDPLPWRARPSITEDAVTGGTYPRMALVRPSKPAATSPASENDHCGPRTGGSQGPTNPRGGRGP